MSLALLLAAAEGHVRLNYIDGSDLPIRNANSATGNGRASVAGGPPLFKTYCFQTHIASEVPLVAAFCRATQAKAASGHSLSPPSESACPGAALQFGALFLCRPLRWGERLWHQWQRGRTGRNGVYDEPPVRRRSHGHIRDVLLVHRHERERSLRCALRPLSNRVSAAAGLGVGGQGGRGSGCGGG